MYYLTEEEKTKLYSSVFSNFDRIGQLMLPDNEIYPQTIDTKSLEKIAKKAFVWIGCKPRNLNYSISNRQSGYEIIEGNKYINLNNNDTSTFVAAPIIARSCIAYQANVKKINLSPETIDCALVDLGFGQLILNSISSSNDISSRLNRIIHFKQGHSPALKILTTKDFLIRYRGFIYSNGLSKKKIIEHSTPWGKNHLNLHYTEPGKLDNEEFVILSRKSVVSDQVKLMGCVFLGLIILILIGALISLAPKRLPKELKAQKDIISTLEDSYYACMTGYAKNRKSANENDIFTKRQLESERNRCESFKNQHDYYLQEYNTKVDQLK